MKGPPAVTEALSTSGKNMKGPPAGNKTMKNPPAGTEALSTSNSVMVSIVFSTRLVRMVLQSGWSSTARMPASSLVLLPSLPLIPPRHRLADGQISHRFTPIAKFHLVWRRLCEALLSSSSLAGEKHLSLLSRLYLKCRRHEGRLGLNMKIKSSIICGHSSGCVHSDVHSSTIVERPIEYH